MEINFSIQEFPGSDLSLEISEPAALLRLKQEKLELDRKLAGFQKL